MPGQECIGNRIKKGSDNQHVVGGAVWQGAGVGGAWHPPSPPETRTLPPAEVLALSSQGRTLLCDGKEEVVAATTVVTTAATDCFSSCVVQK